MGWYGMVWDLMEWAGDGACTVVASSTSWRDMTVTQVDGRVVRQNEFQRYYAK